MIIFAFFTFIYCQNIIKNPSFEEVENNKVNNWILGKGVQLISSDSSLGKKALYWKQTNDSVYSYQTIQLEKGFQYEMCAHFKVKNIPNITKDGFQFMIKSVNNTHGIYEYFYSRSYYGNLDWKKACHLTSIIQKVNNKEKYRFYLYSVGKNNSNGEIFVDNVSVRRINFRIGINNDRDEVFDNINVVYRINGNEENYNLSDFELTTKIRDNNNKIYYNKKTEITSFFFSKKISIKNLE